MRRIKTQTIEGVQWGYPWQIAVPAAPFDAVLMEERDYRLMRAVVKAAEQSLRDPHFRGVFAISVQKTVDAFNAKRKTK